MTNDVNGVSGNGLPKISETASSRKVEQETAPQQQQPGAAQSSSADTVALTDGARLLERVETRLAQAPDVDSVRVEALKAAISEGSYQVDDRAIAEKILRSDQERG